MRVNVYAEEMTERVEIIAKEIDGQQFTGLRIYLELPATVNGQQYQGPFMHRPGDDDSSAVTFWGKRDLRVVLRKALDELDKHYAASASPPRAPGASAHFSGVGVQSGPGQPIDIEALPYCRDPGALAWTKAAAAEIRRLRTTIDECLEAAGIPVGQAEHYVTVPALIADKIGDMEDYAAIRYRAGIEAALRAVTHPNAGLEPPDGGAPSPQQMIDNIAAAIRALADKPAPDAARKGG